MPAPKVYKLSDKNTKDFSVALRLLLFISIIQGAICFVCAFLLAHYEKLSLFDSFYLILITLTTVGYGDLYPVTTGGKVIIIFLLFTGIGYVWLALSVLVATLVEGHLIHFWREKQMERKITKLKNHVIVCGLGRAGTAAIKQLEREGVPIVGIDHDEHYVELMKERGYLVILGDATEDEILKAAGIERARSIISALPSDSANILITMAAKDLNPRIRVVARADRPENIARLKRAGADWVTAVGIAGGARLALAAVKPVTGDFIHSILERRHPDYKLEEILIDAKSPLARKAVRDSRLKEDYGSQLLAIIRNGITIANPDINEIILPGDVIIVFGAINKLNLLETSPGAACPLKPE